ncbi:hypothetical protein N8500_09335 [Candidatus Puniceispirillum sp.]|nr:hypothetical protein [Candidatus Puniceispirillum sp.]
MNKGFGLLLVCLFVLALFASSNAVAGNWNSGSGASGLNSKVLNLKARDLCKVYTSSKDSKYKSLVKKELKKRLIDDCVNTDWGGKTKIGALSSDDSVIYGIEKVFKEPNAVMSEFSNPTDIEAVERERKGPGWRYASSIVEGSNKVIIYNHGHGGRSKHYSLYGYGIGHHKGRKKGLKEKCDWYSAKGINCYAVLRKTASQKSNKRANYGRSIEAAEVFQHMTKHVRKLHGDNVKICYVGHSEGGASVYYSSVFLKGRHVSISPGIIHTPYTWKGTYFQEQINDVNLAKNLTILIGENEPKKNSGYQDLIDGLKGYQHVTVKIIPYFGHGKMSDNRFLDEIGPEVITGCNF